MTAALDHRWADVFQRPGVREWTWQRGEEQHYWSFSFRPRQANEPRCEILRQWTSTDNNLVHTEHLVVEVLEGVLYRLSVIWVSGS